MTWIAKLSNGDVITEGDHGFANIQGERKPWVKLGVYAREHNVTVDRVTIDILGRKVNLPYGHYNWHDLTTIRPLFYGMEYHLEADDVLSGNPDLRIFSDHFVVFRDYEVHYIPWKEDFLMVTERKSHIEEALIPASPALNG